tara:strand:+ start:27 stop:1355 length:1329 start_codon:yes stop_codon:yes gene_type:complete
MKVKLTEQQFRRVILEQIPLYNPDLEAIYQKVAAAAKGWGTDTDTIVLEISKLKNLEEISDFLSLFKDKQSGYSSFDEMINKEYDGFNYPSIIKLEKVLEKWGITSYEQGTNGYGTKMFMGDFKFTPSDKRIESKEGQICATTYEDQLPKAVKWWKDWLNDPITQQKFKKNHNIPSLSLVKALFDRYKKALDKAYIFPYYNDEVTTIAYVQQKIVAHGRIWVNCSQSKNYRNDQEVLETLIHELQHQLHFIHPLNPDKQIGDLFVGPTTNKLTPQDFNILQGKKRASLPISSDIDEEYESIETDIKKLMSLEDWRRTVKRISLELNSNEDTTASWLRYWYEQSIKGKKGDPDYACRATEKGSNIASLRNTLKITPGKGLTIQMLKPFILRSWKKSSGDLDVWWLLLCWATNGFVSLKSFVGEFNELAGNLATGEEEIEDPIT